MIYTVTFNPSLDFIVWVPNLTDGATNRSEAQALYPGGKGINVSIMLSNLGYASKALGFSAGFTGREIERLLEENGCDAEFIPLHQGNSRINIKIKSAQETEINAQGPHISSEALNELFQRLDACGPEDILVLAGSIPKSLPSDIYEQIMFRLRGNKTRIVVDATGDLLKNALKYHPFLVKPNAAELEELYGIRCDTMDKIKQGAMRVRQDGALNVLVSLGKDGALLIDQHGRLHTSPAPSGTLVNSVGSGDSMVAGFLAGYLKEQDYAAAFRMGIAAGSATAFQEWLATKAQVLKEYQALKEYQTLKEYQPLQTPSQTAPEFPG